MWFALSILALLMLTTRRSSEKRVSKNIDSMAMTWLQQAVAMPFIIGSLFFARFYWPDEMSADAWLFLVVWVLCACVDIYLYFKALSIADISYVAPLLTLVSVGNIIGAYAVLGQTPSLFGLIGAALIMSGAYLNGLAKRRQKTNIRSNQLAMLLVLGSVILRSYYSNLEVFVLRETNPVSFNFYTSLLSIPLVLLISYLVVRRRQAQQVAYWRSIRSGVRQHFWPLALVGFTYTVNLLATFHAKLLSPNAGYVGSIKSASVLPVVLIGIFFFKEKVVRLQWIGLALIVLGLVAIANN